MGHKFSRCAGGDCFCDASGNNYDCSASGWSGGFAGGVSGIGSYTFCRHGDKDFGYVQKKPVVTGDTISVTFAGGHALHTTVGLVGTHTLTVTGWTTPSSCGDDVIQYEKLTTSGTIPGSCGGCAGGDANTVKRLRIRLTSRPMNVRNGTPRNVSVSVDWTYCDGVTQRNYAGQWDMVGSTDCNALTNTASSSSCGDIGQAAGPPDFSVSESGTKAMDFDSPTGATHAFAIGVMQWICGDSPPTAFEIRLFVGGVQKGSVTFDTPWTGRNGFGYWTHPDIDIVLSATVLSTDVLELRIYYEGERIGIASSTKTGCTSIPSGGAVAGDTITVECLSFRIGGSSTSGSLTGQSGRWNILAENYFLGKSGLSPTVYYVERLNSTGVIQFSQSIDMEMHQNSSSEWFFRNTEEVIGDSADHTPVGTAIELDNYNLAASAIAQLSASSCYSYVPVEFFRGIMDA